MTKSDIQSILGAKTVSFNSLYAKATGSVTAAVFLSQAVFWQEKSKFKNSQETAEFDGETYFSKTAAEWYDETGLSTEQQKTARRALVLSGILKEKLSGVPAKMYFRIDVEVLVSGISAYLNQGVTVSGFSVNKNPENPRTSGGKFRKQESGKPGSKYIGRELKESLESDGEGGNSLSPGGNSVSLEAEKEKKNPPVPPAPPYAGPTLVELHDAAHPDIPVFDIVPSAPVTQPPTNRIGLGDRPNAETPVQLESALREFYMAWPNEWSVGILENGRGRKYDAPKQVEIVKDFCCWAVDHNRQRDTFRQLNARLQAWFRNEQHSTWKQAKPGQPGNTEKPAYERPKNAIY